MADPRLAPLVLSDDERRTLASWSRRRSTAQGLALRARIVLACADGGSNTAVAARLASTAARSPYGGPGSWPGGWTDCTMSRAREYRAPSLMLRSRR
jgi:hypothetical protein